MNSKAIRRELVGLFLVVIGACAAPDAPHESSSDDDVEAPVLEAREVPSLDGLGLNWLTGGHDLNNTRSQALERRISTLNAGRLGVKWVFQTEGDVWATASVDNTSVYFPDAKGNLYALDRQTGKPRWSRKVAEYTGVPNVIARNTPAVHGNALFLGDQGGRLGRGATVFAVDKITGNKIWATKVEDNAAAVITMSPIVYGDRVFIGVSSFEEVLASRVPGYKCCSFRGSMLALDRFTGAIIWKTYTVPGPETPGYAGGAVWASTPVLDAARGSLYISTGNNYTVPTPVLDCQSLPAAEVAACVKEVPGWETNHFDSILALDVRTGAVKWAHSGAPFDSWNIACLAAAPGNEGNCTQPHGEDYDFGNGTILFSALVGGRPRQLLGAGQKSGVYWAIDPNDGAVVWKTQVGPGGSLGGLEWGSAYDGRRIYTAVSNSGAKPYTLPSGEQTTSGSWAALDPATGKILWQTRGTPATANTNQGPVSVANGVVYAGTIDAAGTMYALEATTGRTLWTFASGGSVNTSPAIADGTLFWGSGYGVQGFGITPNNKFYAFAVGANNLPPAPDAGMRDAGIDAAAPPIDHGGAPRWSRIFDDYLGAGTVGHCQNCHADMVSAARGHAWLTTVGQVAGVGSLLASPERSRLTWFGGEMPPGGPAEYPEARRDIEAWVAAGALNN